MSSTIHRSRRYRPRLEALEERCQPTTFTVVLTTDTGGSGGQMVSATTGDLRYCISQADATHTATHDTIVFSNAVFGTPQTITLDSTLGPLVVNDAHRLTIKAAALGRVTVSGGDATEVFDVAGGTVAMRNLVISHGAASGGGINNSGNLTLTDCILDHDEAADGGGINNGGNLTLTDCTLSNDGALAGGGINNGGTATLTDCTLSNDLAAGDGGGIVNGGVLTLTNCTLSNNRGDLGGGDFGGGGIDNFGKATLTNCTLSNNSNFSGGGIANSGSGATLNLTNTIVAGNSAPTNPDIDNTGTVMTADHNLIGDGSGSGISNGTNGNQVGGNGNSVIDPRLGPLANNGGPTQTLALLPGSPALGKADNAAAPHTDQRGHVRLDEDGETTDIGAFEL
jgi:hypothetical protein